MRASSEMAPSGLTVKEGMLYQQDDFLRLHMWTLRFAMEYRIHETRYQFDVKKRFMRIGLYIFQTEMRTVRPTGKNFVIQFAATAKRYESYV